LQQPLQILRSAGDKRRRRGGGYDSAANRRKLLRDAVNCTSDLSIRRISVVIGAEIARVPKCLAIGRSLWARRWA
jgi:hypothetical protein